MNNETIGYPPANTIRQYEKPKSTDYEVWLKMAADNKINAKNSWNFALIDYFYDLSQQPIVNFPKASAILDGCIKIYSSRVDSAVTETGTLLSGLAADKTLKRLNHPLDDQLNDIDHESENISGSSKTHRRRNIRLENTLVKSFEHIKSKRLERELNVDPMFRKTLSYFDEGGAKSLLLNNLNIDLEGRLVFDTHSNEDIKTYLNDRISRDSWETLKLKFFDPGDDIDSLKVCESMPGLKHLLQNPDASSQTLTPIELLILGDDIDIDLDYEDDVHDNEHVHDRVNIDIGFDDVTNMGVDHYGHKNDIYELSEIPDYDLMNYFDNTLKQSFARTDYWKVGNIRNKLFRNQDQLNEPNTSKSSHVNTNSKITDKPKDKQLNIIDFIKKQDLQEELAFEDEIFSESDAKIYIPVIHIDTGKTNNNYCLPEDLQFRSKRLIQLFTKPTTTLKSFNKKIIKENLTINETLNNYNPSYDEPSRLMDEITREDLADLNETFNDDYNYTIQDLGADDDHNNMVNDVPPYENFIINPLRSQLNHEKISRRFDIKQIKQAMIERIHDQITFSELVKSIPPALNGSISIYFICLLHLCNEFNYNLHNTGNDLLVYKYL